MNRQTTSKSMLLTRRPPRRTKTLRRGNAVVELAVSLPVLVLIVLGAIEGSNKIFIRQAAVQAAYEVAKSAKDKDGTPATARVIGRQVLSARNIRGSTITFQPARVDLLDGGELFTVTVSVPGNARTVTGIGPFGGITITAQATMVKEQ